MNNGYSQQIDSPQVVYEKPHNLFVAGFMGSPQMNFQEVVLKKDAEIVCITFGPHTMKLPGNLAEEIENLGYLGKSVMMCIRPENIQETPVLGEALQDSVMEARVEVVERLGSETLLHVRAGETKWIARVGPGTTARAGDRIPLALDVNKIHLFDKETEKNICFESL